MAGGSWVTVVKQGVQVAAFGFASGFLLERNAHKLPLVHHLVPSLSGEASGTGTPATLIRITGMTDMSPFANTPKSTPKSFRSAAFTVYDGARAVERE
mmetsp:Transcript_30397/g.70984  ORF Transcript_30397/g.70984 Transcript_30397/m.70984 type:complete len:98 (-) Transcript_30397:238-531(-)